MNKELLQKEVANFRQQYGFGRSINDAYTPWWISNRFNSSPAISMSNSSDGSSDFGLDGFWIDNQENFSTVYFIQSKYTDDINQIKTGISDFAKDRFLKIIQAIIRKDEPDNANINNVLIKLYHQFKEIINKSINIKFVVISLSEEEPEFINTRLANSRKETLKAVQSSIGDFVEVSDISVLTAKNILSEKKENPIDQIDKIFFDGSESVVLDDSHFHSGLSKLSDLVNLYKTYSNHLFERNVRYYLFSRKNIEHGPAGKIQETLLQICMDKKYSYNRFAFLHNGITIFAESAKIDKENKQVYMKNPCVLNGCQTIKSAYFFYQQKKETKNFDDNIWNLIPITLRIVISKDNKLWKDVAEANNRQNALKPSALKANDEEQIKLEHIMKKIKIFYERQEGAFKNIATTSPVLIATDYQGSPKEPITFEKLSRAMLMASDLPLYLYNSMNKLFENDEWYSKLFNSSIINENNAPYFVLISNIQKVIHLSLSEIVKESGENGKYSNFPISKFQPIIFRLILKVINVKNLKDSFLEDFGYSVINSNNSNDSLELRNKLKTIVRSKEYPILQTISEFYKKDNEWQEPYDTNTSTKVQKKLGVENIKNL